MKPLISVIIPCYNCSSFLEETIQSVFDQTFKSYEIILVNDGSMDNSLSIMRKYSRLNIVKILTQKNKGVSAARNAGIAQAKGRYLYFLDSDDLLHPDAFQTLKDVVAESDITIGFMRVARFRGYIKNVIKLDEVIDHFWPDLIFTTLAPLSAFLFPAHMVRNVNGFNELISFGEDWEFLLRMAFAGAKLETTKFIGAYYRIHGASACRTYSHKKRLYGYVRLQETLCDGFLKRKDLLYLYGQQAFWSAWGTLVKAKRYSIPWSYLKDLDKALRRLSWALIFSRKATPFIYCYALLGAKPLLKKFARKKRVEEDICR